MNAKIAAQTVDYVAATSALTDRLLTATKQAAAKEKRAAEVAPGVLKLLVENGLVSETQKSAAAKLLGDHAGTLQILENAITKLAEFKAREKAAAAELGHPVTEKEAGVAQAAPVIDSMSDPYVGRRTSQKKASDLALLKVLNKPRG